MSDADTARDGAGDGFRVHDRQRRMAAQPGMCSPVAFERARARGSSEIVLLRSERHAQFLRLLRPGSFKPVAGEAQLLSEEKAGVQPGLQLPLFRNGFARLCRFVAAEAAGAGDEHASTGRDVRRLPV